MAHGTEPVGRRLVLVHAHPDDETTTTGATMARYAAEGAHVTLVTCTRGEEGEVLVEDLAHLAAGREDRLGEQREAERAAAMAELGPVDARWLGGRGEYRDSGMAGETSNGHPAAFCRVPVDHAATRLAQVLREVRPQVLVTYDPHGGYHHPDHVQAHRVAMRAVELAADPRHGAGEAWTVAKVYWCAWAETPFREAVRRMREAGYGFDDLDPDADLPPFVVPDDQVTTLVDAARWGLAKLAAMRRYVTQVGADSPLLAFADQEMAGAWSREAFVLARGRAVPDPQDPEGRETDLFAGVA